MCKIKVQQEEKQSPRVLSPKAINYNLRYFLLELYIYISYIAVNTMYIIYLILYLFKNLLLCNDFSINYRNIISNTCIIFHSPIDLSLFTSDYN